MDWQLKDAYARMPHLWSCCLCLAGTAVVLVRWFVSLMCKQRARTRTEIARPYHASAVTLVVGGPPARLARLVTALGTWQQLMLA